MSGFKAALSAGETRVGILCGAGSAQFVELCGWLGFDFVLLDMEHGDGLDLGATLRLIRAADAAGVDVIVRVARYDAGIIQNLLDYGAEGICVPHVQSAEDAERTVRAVKYPPDGTRAMSPFVRAAKYVTERSWSEFWPGANEETVVMLIVEEPAGVENLAAIAAVPGVDVLWIGTGDLSQSMGVPSDSPVIQDARSRGLAEAKRHSIAAYSPIVSSALVDRSERQRQFRTYRDDGYTVFGVLDTAVLSAALAELLDAVRA
jgi:4-hydroxy-2-oxoheptanedioate aldolase